MWKVAIRSLNVGKPIELPFGNKRVTTGIQKKPISKPVFLTTVNFIGDGQGDLVHHGGIDKAVCAYPAEHYPYWEEQLGRPLPYGAFGENLTLEGLTEKDVCIGDSFQIGESIVQVSQPRQPCYKLGLLYERKDMPLLVQNSGFTGFYFRVLQEGMVSPSDELIPLHSQEKAISVAEANRIMHHDKSDLDAVQHILKVNELSGNWRKTFERRLEGNEVDTRERLSGKR
ncbi:MOSC domain-containing protein [Sporosarcina cyprini]|uniref:MOSC domain-containing protein n=1 Tax=Sporosarcina cyprini TaxID=2910523 RepID=UPI001EDF9F77|nr:MOSC domain-containing protein [Sporosarcina cyprini]MCG3087150.1 MOSC domain-containing protein [Sporosarcina cyprini]